MILTNSGSVPQRAPCYFGGNPDGLDAIAERGGNLHSLKGAKLIQ